MIDLKRYNGTEEFNRLLKKFVVIPTNTEIVEKTGVSKGSVSEIMSGKRTPTKKFNEKFSEGFNLNDKPETKNPLLEINGFDVYKENTFLVNENAFLKETIKELLKNLNK